MSTTVVYCATKLPPAASIAAPASASTSASTSGGARGQHAGGRHLVQPGVAAVGPLPLEPPPLRLAEPARRPQPVLDLAEPSQIDIRGRPRVGRDAER